MGKQAGGVWVWESEVPSGSPGSSAPSRPYWLQVLTMHGRFCKTKVSVLSLQVYCMGKQSTCDVCSCNSCYY